MSDVLATDQLETFVTVARTGSFTRAAELLYRSQPAVSLQIKRLEDQLGSDILSRRGRSIELTESGRLLFDYAQRILSLDEEVRTKFDAIETEGSVAVGILEEVAVGPLVDILTRFGKLCSRIKVTLQVSTSWDLLRQIESGELGLAVANSAYARRQGTPLWKENYVFAKHIDYELPSTGPIPIIIDPSHSPCEMRDNALSNLERAGKKWDVVFSTVSLTATIAAIRAGLGVGLLAKSAVASDMIVMDEDGGFEQIPPSQIGLYRSDNARSEAATILHGFLKNNLSENNV